MQRRNSLTPEGVSYSRGELQLIWTAHLGDQGKARSYAIQRQPASTRSKKHSPFGFVQGEQEWLCHKEEGRAPT